MGKTLFFEGPIRIGKSTFLRDEINRKGIPFCGFVVARIYQEDQIVGYQSIAIQNEPAPSVDQAYYPNIPGLFLHRKKEDVSILEKTLLTTEQYSHEETTNFILLDEIGGVELLSDSFMSTLIRLLDSSLPIIGILKSRENLKRTVSKLHLPEEYLKRHQALTDIVLRKGNIHSVNQNTVSSIQQKTSFFLEAL